MKDNKKELRKHRGCNRTKTKLYNGFKIYQSKFDKILRNTEWNYFRDFGNKLETINTENPREFWDKIKNLGPHIGTTYDQVLLDDGSLSSDKSIAFRKWVNDFNGLYYREVDN